jgi:hypothetical protein
MSNMARHHKALADAIEVQIEALGLVIHSLKRQRDAHRSMQEFFTPPATPFPPIVPPPAGPDPDFEDLPEGDSPATPEAAP